MSGHKRHEVCGVVHATKETEVVLARIGSITFVADSGPDRLDLYAKTEGPLGDAMPRQLGLTLMFGEIEDFEKAVKKAVRATVRKRR